MLPAIQQPWRRWRRQRGDAHSWLSRAVRLATPDSRLPRRLCRTPSAACPADARVLQVDAPDGASPYVLPGHQGEVTAVAWCPTDFHQVTLPSRPPLLPPCQPPAAACRRPHACQRCLVLLC